MWAPNVRSYSPSSATFPSLAPADQRAVSRELCALFRDIDSSKDSSITPRQRLANAALLRPEKIRPISEQAAAVAGPANAEAPPLPPRTGDCSELEAGVEPAAESPETASAESSQTLVEKPDDDPSSYVVVGRDPDAAGTTAMEIDHSEAPATGFDKSTEAKNSKLTVEELAAELDKPNVGSDQMDVDEVMGNAIDHLRAAYKVAHIGREDAGPDPIEQAFFSTFIDSRKKVNEESWNRTTRKDRWVTAYPAKSGRLDLYDALSASFDLEHLPGDLLSQTTIERPAPHFHICIQRSDGVSKNSNPIRIPETLYLDRWMHTVDVDSRLSMLRKQGWDTKNRLNEMEPSNAEPAKESNAAGSKPASDATKPEAEDLPNDEDIDEYLVIEKSDIPTMDSMPGSANESDSGIVNSTWSLINTKLEAVFANHPAAKTTYPSPAASIESQESGEGDNDSKPPPAIPAASLDEFWLAFHAAQDEQKARLKAYREELFKDCQDVAYRLHAVVCHAGTTARAGHYWVWIHDFEQDVWRKYNDTTVSIHPASFVFNELSTKGEPYYLAYVRASEIDQLVSVPPRKQPEQTARRDTEMTGITQGDKSTVEHVEDVEMDPPPYSIN